MSCHCLGSTQIRHFLLGAPFILETDHKPLMWLESAKPSNARSQRLERWTLELRAFNFTDVHRLGTSNTHADTLSRLPVSLVAVEAALSTSQISQAQRKVKSPTMSEEKLLIVVPYSLRKEFLAIAHDKAGH